MGIGFVIILHFVFIFILSLLIAVISALVTYFFTDKEKKKRKMFLATFTPFQTLYTFYILLFVGAIVVSEMKDVDLGIGDTWYAPINKTCRILMIDLPEQAHIECSGTTIISHVSHLQQLENKIIGKTYDDVYFSSYYSETGDGQVTSNDWYAREEWANDDIDPKLFHHMFLNE